MRHFLMLFGVVLVIQTVMFCVTYAFALGFDWAAFRATLERDCLRMLVSLLMVLAAYFVLLGVLRVFEKE